MIKMEKKVAFHYHKTNASSMKESPAVPSFYSKSQHCGLPCGDASQFHVKITLSVKGRRNGGKLGPQNEMLCVSKEEINATKLQWRANVFHSYRMWTLKYSLRSPVGVRRERI